MMDRQNQRKLVNGKGQLPVGQLIGAPANSSVARLCCNAKDAIERTKHRDKPVPRHEAGALFKTGLAPLLYLPLPRFNQMRSNGNAKFYVQTWVRVYLDGLEVEADSYHEAAVTAERRIQRDYAGEG